MYITITEKQFDSMDDHRGLYHVICVDGSEHWFKNGKKHRLYKHASIYSNGDRQWFFNGYHHNLYGPAMISSSGCKAYYLKGRECSKDVFISKLSESAMKRFLLNYENF